jgi:pimeloyl-ACP methyl ester carboxylesterase
VSFAKTCYAGLIHGCDSEGTLMATFVLVHGSWHGGWCWKKLTPILRQHGHEVHTPTLTGMGDRQHLLAENVGLSIHAQDIAAFLYYEDLRDVVLVGHSYGGMVISGAAELEAERIKRLIFLDAVIPKDNQSIDDIFPGTVPHLRQQAISAGETWRIPPQSPQAYGVVDPVDALWMEQRLCPISILTYEERIRLVNPAAALLARSYIWCKLHNMLKAVAAQAKTDGYDYHELDASHDAMITAPAALAAILEICAMI